MVPILALYLTLVPFPIKSAMEYVVAALSAVITGVFGWAFTLSNRVSILETSYNGLKELIDSRFDDIEGRLDRIERAMNGHFYRD